MKCLARYEAFSRQARVFVKFSGGENGYQRASVFSVLAVHAQKEGGGHVHVADRILPYWEGASKTDIRKVVQDRFPTAQIVGVPKVSDPGYAKAA